ncbi:hypothetical protein MtrunA17_Chr8g0388611 [Medicago truncatula]|uniref:Transmembrane protein n=1 Tax=Medicago truncatula TaxID=3880 RepID=A0A396GSJ2_MEDTR|nr:hypothetical protein MtrunA17_Chr8g0388611 [Medicago truncatula]
MPRCYITSLCFYVFPSEFLLVLGRSKSSGERLSPWVAVGCFTMGVSILFF